MCDECALCLCVCVCVCCHAHGREAKASLADPCNRLSTDSARRNAQTAQERSQHRQRPTGQRCIRASLCHSSGVPAEGHEPAHSLLLRYACAQQDCDDNMFGCRLDKHRNYIPRTYSVGTLQERIQATVSSLGLWSPTPSDTLGCCFIHAGPKLAPGMRPGVLACLAALLDGVASALQEVNPSA